MQKRTLITLLAVACTGCPADIINNYYGETAGDESTSEPAPDLPAATESGESGSESDSGTETGDGDGDPGDGDGDGEPDPDIGALIVESAGEPIGYLMGAWDYGFLVWDDINEVTFRINDQTGHVARDIPHTQQVLHYWYQSADCTGQRYQPLKFADVYMVCDEPTPTRRPIIVDGGTLSGSEPGAFLQVTVGSPFLMAPSSGLNGLPQCFETSTNACVMEVQPTDVIPVTFPLPITVAESTEP